MKEEQEGSWQATQGSAAGKQEQQQKAGGGYRVG